MPPPPIGSVVSDSGWYLKDHSIAADLVTLNALKQTSGGGLKSTVTDTPSNDEVVEYLLTDDGLAALTDTIASILGDDVIWELDVINKRVSYRSLN